MEPLIFIPLFFVLPTKEAGHKKPFLHYTFLYLYATHSGMKRVQHQLMK